MKNTASITDWSPDDTAVLIEGEFDGMLVKIWKVNPTEHTAVVSLRVFSEDKPFEVDLAHLQKPKSGTRVPLRATGYALLTLASGPILWFIVLGAVEWIQGRSVIAVFSWGADLFDHFASCVLSVSFFLAIYVFARTAVEKD